MLVDARLVRFKLKRLVMNLCLEASNYSIFLAETNLGSVEYTTKTLHIAQCAQ